MDVLYWFQGSIEIDPYPVCLEPYEPRVPIDNTTMHSQPAHKGGSTCNGIHFQIYLLLLGWAHHCSDFFSFEMYNRAPKCV